LSQPALEEQLEPESADSVGAARARSSWELFRARFVKDKAAVVGAVAIVVLVLLALTAPLFARLVGHGPNDLFQNQMLDPVFGLPKGPNRDFWFGADTVGRDLFVRVIYGARTSLTVAFVATGLASLIGVSLGMIAGYRGGATDTVISRAADIVLAMPVLLFAIGIATVCSVTAQGCLGGLLQPGLSLVIGTIAIFTWPNMARLVRGQVLSLREREFIEAARSLGARSGRVMFRELLPNLVAPIVVATSLSLPAYVTAEAGLSYLGIGVTGIPSLGQTIFDAQNYWDVYPIYLWAPVLTITVLVLALNLLGDSIRDAFDPRTRR